MEPVIPLQPYIREGEGHGSAFILPQYGSSLDPILKIMAAKKQERMADKKEFQDQLIKLNTIKGGLIPEHEAQILQEKNALTQWMGEQKAKGRDVYTPGSDANIEARQKMAELEAAIAKGKVAKEFLSQKQREFDPRKHIETSFTDLVKGITNTNVNDLNYSEFGDLKAIPDVEGYKTKVAKNIGEKVTPDFNNVMTLPGGEYAVTITKSKDPYVAADAVLNDTKNPDAQELISQAHANYDKLSEEDRSKIFNKIVKDNVSLAEPKNQKLLQDAITKEMVARQFAFEDKREFKPYSNLEYQLALRQKADEEAGKNRSQMVQYETRDIQPDSEFAKKYTGMPGTGVVHVDVSEPAQGENKPQEYNVDVARLDMGGDQLISKKVPGGKINGKLIGINKWVGSDGKPKVEAEIVGTSNLTNAQVNPEKYLEVSKTPPFQYVLREDLSKEDVKKAGEKAQLTFYVPYNQVAKNQHAKYKSFKNKKGFIQEVEERTGVKYSDFSDTGAGKGNKPIVWKPGMKIK